MPGLLVATVVWLTIDIDKPDFSFLRGFDVTGLLLMAIFPPPAHSLPQLPAGFFPGRFRMTASVSACRAVAIGHRPKPFTQSGPSLSARL